MSTDSVDGSIQKSQWLQEACLTPDAVEALLVSLAKHLIREAWSESVLDLQKRHAYSPDVQTECGVLHGPAPDALPQPDGRSRTGTGEAVDGASRKIEEETSAAVLCALNDWDHLHNLMEEFFFARQTGRRRLEGATAANFRSDFKQALSYFRGHHAALTGEALESYVRWLELEAKTPSGTRYALASVVRKKTSLSSLLTWAKRKGAWTALDHIPILSSKKRDKTAKNPHRALAPTDDFRYLTAARDLPLAERIMALLGRHCGLRAADIGKLSWSEVDLANRRLEYVPMKSGKVVRVPLNAEMHDLLSEFRATCATETVLFPVESKGTADRKTVLALVHRTAAKAGIARHVTPHDLRKTYATANYYAGADLLALQEWLGHEDINTTRAYIDTTAGWTGHGQRCVRPVPRHSSSN